MAETEYPLQNYSFDRAKAEVTKLFETWEIKNPRTKRAREIEIAFLAGVESAMGAKAMNAAIILMAGAGRSVTER